MASIGGRSVTVFQGFMVRAVKSVDVIPGQPGVNGSAIALGGWKAPTTTIRTSTRFNTRALADAEGEVYRGLSGQPVTVVDQFGTTWTNVRVIAVNPIATEDVRGGVLRATWQLLPTSVAAA